MGRRWDLDKVWQRQMLMMTSGFTVCCPNKFKSAYVLVNNKNKQKIINSLFVHFKMELYFIALKLWEPEALQVMAFFLSFEKLIIPHCKTEEVTFCFYFINAGPYFIIYRITFFLQFLREDGFYKMWKYSKLYFLCTKLNGLKTMRLLQ